MRITKKMQNVWKSFQFESISTNKQNRKRKLIVKQVDDIFAQ